MTDRPPVLKPLRSPHGSSTPPPRRATRHGSRLRPLPPLERIASVLTVFATLALPVVVLVATYTRTSHALTTPHLLGTFDDVEAIATDGRTVAITERHSDRTTLSTLELPSAEAVPIVRTDSVIERLVVAGDTVIWSERACPECPGRIMLARHTGEQPRAIAQAADEGHPAADDRWVAWISRNGRERLYVMDLTMPEYPTVITYVGEENSHIVDLWLQAARLTWLEQDSDRSSQHWVVRSRPVRGSDEPAIVWSGTQQPKILLPTERGLVLAVDDHSLSFVSWSGEILAIGTPPIASTLLTSDGRYVFWVSSDPSDPTKQAILGFDAVALSRFVAVPDASSLVALAAGEGWLIWLQRHQPNRTTASLWGAPISDLLPSAPRTASEMTSAHWRYFPDTGHYLANGFRAFWERYGGLDSFGYPLTEEFDEYDPESAGFRTVQYFERARFAWQPDSPAAIDGVVLDRIGVEYAREEQLAASRPFRALERASQQPSVGECRYFPNTGHRVCGLFLAYWLAHGLRQAADETAEAAAIRRFGYPISEPLALPNGMLVQYFERVRLEYRPHGNERLQVGRVGAELLVRRGWLAPR